MNGSFDVFLSYNSKDKPTVRQLARALQARGLRVWLDEEQLVPGRPWQEALEAVIQTIRTAAVLVGKDGLGPWEIPEMRAYLSEFVNRQLPVIPVLLPDADAPIRPELPLFLRAFTWVDLRGGLTEDGLNRLEWGITGVKPGERAGLLHQNEPAQSDPANPGEKPLLSWWQRLQNVWYPEKDEGKLAYHWVTLVSCISGIIALLLAAIFGLHVGPREVPLLDKIASCFPSGNNLASGVSASWQEECLRLVPEAIRLCDAAAGDPDDPYLKKQTAVQQPIDTRMEIACHFVLEYTPSNLRIRHQFARILDYSDRHAEALEQFKMAADGGYPAAAADVARLMVASDKIGEEALTYASLAAKANSCKGMFWLGMIEKGANRYDEGERWIEKAASCGYKKAKNYH